MAEVSAQIEIWTYVSKDTVFVCFKGECVATHQAGTICEMGGIDVCRVGKLSLFSPPVQIDSEYQSDVAKSENSQICL